MDAVANTTPVPFERWLLDHPEVDDELDDLPWNLALSGIIFEAVDALERAERAPGYVVDMNEWHTPMSDGKCSMCLAGAWLAEVFRIGPEVEVPKALNKLPPRAYNPLYALDQLRHGELCEAAGWYYGKTSDEFVTVGTLDITEWRVPDYRDDPSGFKATLRAMGHELVTVGL